ncbi:hypothetical protein PIB30_034697 [Stylosanthes scabra]|uniref:Uncharacterized protein n=1 Tax=Stylosanthes scabra TaxID=79078 RepID=A0ABU6TCM4_9FABA|nr:hypothetical protein [Stylosanthes scabra]
MNWARHVYSFLLNEIQEMRKKNLKSVDGCVFALLIIYIFVAGVLERRQLQKRIKVEFEDSGGLVNQARSRVSKRLSSAGKKTTKKVEPPKKAQIMSSTLAKSL